MNLMRRCVRASFAVAAAVAVLAVAAAPALALRAARAQDGPTSGAAAADTGEPAAMTMTLRARAPIAGGAVGLSAWVRDAEGAFVTDGVPVAWLSSLGAVEPVTSTTRGGEARSIWRSTVAGRGYVTAVVSGLIASANLNWSPGPPAQLAFSAPARMGVGGRGALRAEVRDAYGNAVSDGVRVAFIGNGGRAEPAIAFVSSGVATSTWLAGAVPGTFNVRATVAEGADGGPAAQAAISLEPADLGLSSVLSTHAGPIPEAQAHPGDPLTWTLRVVNEGLATARDAELEIRLPSELLPPVLRASAAVTDRASGPTAAWLLPDLEPGSALTVTLATGTRRDDPWGGADLLFLQAALTTTTAEASPFDLRRTDQVRIHAADLFASATLDVARSSLRPGGSLVYDLAVGNDQPQTRVVGARITDTLPPGTYFDHWEAQAGTVLTETVPFSPDDTELVWHVLGAMPPAGGLRLWLRIDDDVRPQTVLRNRVRVGSPVLDVRSSNDSRQDDGAWIAGVDLQLAFDAPSEGLRGEALRYVLRTRNAALRDDATNVFVDVVLAPGAVLTSVEGPGEPIGDGRLRWRLESLGPGAEREVAFTASLPEDAVPGESFSFVGVVGADEPESNAADNRVVATTIMRAGPPASLRIGALRTSLDVCARQATMLSALVQDADGLAVSDGTQVSWTVDRGGFGPGEMPAVTGITTTTTAGTTELRFVAHGAPGAATVVASAVDARAEQRLTLVPGQPSVLSTSAHPMVAPPGSRSRIVVEVLDACARPVADDTSITLRAERGRFVGTGPSGSEVVLATLAGRVESELAVGQVPGPLRVTALGPTGSLRAEVQLDVPDLATAVPPRWSVYLPFMRGGVRPVRAATR